MAKQMKCYRMDSTLLRRVSAIRAAMSGPVHTETDYIEQAIYERVLRDEAMMRRPNVTG